MEKKSIKNIFKNLLFFVILIALTFGILLKDQSMSELVNTILNVKFEFLLIGIMCMFLYMTCEAINIKRVIGAFGEKVSIFRNIKYALIGFFFSSITPAASGGQPMQIYYMHKDKIPVAKSTLALLLNLIGMQVITIGFALISLCFNFANLSHTILAFFALGIFLNSMALTLLIIGIFSKKLCKLLVNITIKIMKFFKIKNIEEKQIKIEKELTKYQEYSEYLKKNKMIVVKTILTSAIQFFIYYAISYFVYRAFGYESESVFKIVSLQSILFATVSGIPSPGAVGVSEGAFLEIFKNIYPKELIKSVTLVHRGISFYLFVIIGAITVSINTMLLSRKNKEIQENIDE